MSVKNNEFFGGISNELIRSVGLDPPQAQTHPQNENLANPDLFEFQPKNNLERRALCSAREQVPPKNAPEYLLAALKEKCAHLKKSLGKAAEKNPVYIGLRGEIAILEGSIKTNTRDSGRAELEKTSHKKLVALDAPKLSKMGKVGALLAGFVFGAGLVAGLTLNPVGWAILAVGALALVALSLYHANRGTALQAGKFAILGMALGAASMVAVGAVGAGALGSAAAGVVKSGIATVSHAMAPTLSAIASNLKMVFMGGFPLSKAANIAIPFGAEVVSALAVLLMIKMSVDAFVGPKLSEFTPKAEVGASAERRAERRLSENEVKEQREAGGRSRSEIESEKGADRRGVGVEPQEPEQVDPSMVEEF